MIVAQAKDITSRSEGSRRGLVQKQKQKQKSRGAGTRAAKEQQKLERKYSIRLQLIKSLNISEGCHCMAVGTTNECR